MDFPGADVIARKAEPFMAGQASPALLTPHQMACNELPRLAHDDIGACKDTHIHLSKSIVEVFRGKLITSQLLLLKQPLLAWRLLLV